MDSEAPEGAWSYLGLADILVMDDRRNLLVLRLSVDPDPDPDSDLEPSVSSFSICTQDISP